MLNKTIASVFTTVFITTTLAVTVSTAQSLSNYNQKAMNATANLQPTKPVYDYETVPNDPIGTKIYTLKNGLKLYLSVNKNEPRCYTNIAVRAGSKQDPAETTGLAHYLEHMMFKGTSQIASLNWEKEQVVLKEIADLYEAHKKKPIPQYGRLCTPKLTPFLTRRLNSWRQMSTINSCRRSVRRVRTLTRTTNQRFM